MCVFLTFPAHFVKVRAVVVLDGNVDRLLQIVAVDELLYTTPTTNPYKILGDHRPGHCLRYGNTVTVIPTETLDATNSEAGSAERLAAFRRTAKSRGHIYRISMLHRLRKPKPM